MWKTQEPCFQTARLVLRLVNPADRADLLALEADPQVMRYLNGGLPVPAEGVVDGDFLTPRGTEPDVLCARDVGTHRFIGWFALFDDGLVDGVRTAELGYRLARSAWGRGLATEGARVLVDEALHRLGFERVRAQTMTVNLGSRRVLEKAGFVHTVTVFPDYPVRFAGSEEGEAIYEVRRQAHLAAQ